MLRWQLASQGATAARTMVFHWAWNKYFAINLMYNLCGQKHVSCLSKPGKWQHGAPAVHPSPYIEKYYSYSGLIFVLTWSPLTTSPELDDLFGPPANSELTCCFGEPERRATVSAATQLDACKPATPAQGAWTRYPVLWLPTQRSSQAQGPRNRPSLYAWASGFLRLRTLPALGSWSSRHTSITCFAVVLERLKMQVLAASPATQVCCRTAAYWRGVMKQLLLCISSSHGSDPRTALAAHHPSCHLCKSRHLLSLPRAPPSSAFILWWPPFRLPSTTHIKNLPGERICFIS